jgi:hypothetical protein
VEGVSLPIVVETDVPEFEADLPPGTYGFSVRLLDDLGEVSKATPELQELVVEDPVPVEMISELHGTSSQEGIEITWWTEAEDRASLILVERMRQSDLGFLELHRMLPVTGSSRYLDAGVVAGETYSYRLVAIGRTGDRWIFGPILVTAGSAAPAFSLRPGHPNPFSASTRLQFSLPERVSVTLSIFDAGGRRVRTVDLGERPAGVHSVTWNGRNQSGQPVPAGVYFVSLRAGGAHATSRLIRVDR